MNRVIKFRIWNGQAFRYDLYNEKNGIFIEDQGGRFAEDYQDFGKALNIQQFTGLLDKNGREIFEGDIVETDREGGHNIYNIRSAVEFQNGQFGFKLNGFNKYFVDLYGDTRFNKLKIIGNIFENKELLQS